MGVGKERDFGFTSQVRKDGVGVGECVHDGSGGGGDRVGVFVGHMLEFWLDICWLYMSAMVWMSRLLALRPQRTNSRM